ncbi:hypothetical protein GCM10011491_39420 [Brucella endophytica]|uniref:DUF1963 domain-containing protein n=1 Tax=Brucella endophytica TaxID=1963359 RepID=A0A916SPQ3_9HYPH|nr:DUF1963 domain-containing protein [Brucella endophytica]GGB07480.1 hypothetical protein GCM10011491_39420 [Brucella endophytica]
MRKWVLLASAVIVVACLANLTGRAKMQDIGGFPLQKQAPVPLPSTRGALSASLAQVGELTPDLVERLAGQAAPAILLETVKTTEDAIPLGASKFGGAPDLPADIPWPVRPPYPDWQKKRDQYRKRMAQTLAKAGMMPDWMTPEEGRRYIEEQKRIEREVVDSTLAMLSEEDAKRMRPIFEEQMTYTPERAREGIRDEVLQAEMVGKSLPLSFIAQFDLGALSAEPGFDPDLPKSGRLLLFYDLLEIPPGWEPSARTGFRLIWDDTPAQKLRRASVPEALSSISYQEKLVLEPARVLPRSVVTPITPDEEAWDAIPLDSNLEENFGKGPYWAYMAWLSRFGSPGDAGRVNHQLGGWPQPLQNGMQARAQLASSGIAGGNSDAYDTPEAEEALKGAAEWKLVLQIGVDEAVGLRAGAYYVLMRRADLLARRFDTAWVVYESD